MISNQRESICAYANSFENGRAYKRTVTVRCHCFRSESIDEYARSLLKLEGGKEGRKEGKGKETRKKNHAY